MVKQIISDPRLKINYTELETTLGKPVVVNVAEFDNDTFLKMQDAFSLAHTIKQDIIPVCVNSYGGDAHILMGMISLIKQSKIPVITICESMAMSAGAILFAFGAQRYIAPDATVMIHDVWHCKAGKVEELKSNTVYTDKLNTTMYHLMAKQCGKADSYFLDLIHDACHAEIYMDATEALTHGIATKIKVPTFSCNIKVEYKLE